MNWPTTRLTPRIYFWDLPQLNKFAVKKSVKYEDSRHDKLTIQGRGVWQLCLEGWLAQEHAWDKKEIYSIVSPFPCTSELITWNSVKIYELALLICQYKSSKPKKKFLAFLIMFKQLTQSAITRFRLGILNTMENNQLYRSNLLRYFESNASLNWKPAMWRAAFSKKE